MISHSPILCTTDEACPISGLWESLGNFKTSCVITKGVKMPDYCGTVIHWKLIYRC